MKKSNKGYEPRCGQDSGESTEIQELRKAVDKIDDHILDLLNQRATLVINIGKLKATQNKELYVPQREQEIYQRLASQNRGPFPTDGIRAVFREILSASLSLEKPMKVSFLGPRATFTHLACMEYFGRSSRFITEKNIRDVFEGVERERVDYGVIPIENSTEGVIPHTLDLFVDSEIKVCAEILMEISLDLLSNYDRLHEVKKVYSHPHAIAQCKNWLEKHLSNAQIIDVESTARAAEIVTTEPYSAAIASSFAGKLYELNVLERRIQDHPHNYTRFLVIGKREVERTGYDKTSVMFSLTHSIGALFNALRPFAEHQVNLTKIESRPHKKIAWEYVFFLDMEGHREDDTVKTALEEFKKVCSEFKLLGSYPRGREKNTTIQHQHDMKTNKEKDP
jgi:chorismate mutase/prephenate dehydratase